MRISLVIPTYGANGNGSRLLSKLLDSIRLQERWPDEVIVSDHSLDDEIERLCSHEAIPITYIRNSQSRGNSSSNMNCGIQAATGDLIKIMHMDDWFATPKAIAQVEADLIRVPSARWGVMGFNHFNHASGSVGRAIIPNLRGTLGCPSTSFFLRNSEEPDLFDELLVVINDHDFHQRLLWKYGQPLIVPEIGITIGVHPLQVSSRITKRRVKSEMAYFALKQELMIANAGLSSRLQ